VSEEWRPVVGWEGLYEISNLGVVRRASAGRLTYAGRILKPCAHNAGYVMVGFSAGARKERVLVHRVVALAFLGPVPPSQEVNHRNGLKTDNRLENLEYVSRARNLEHAREIGLYSVTGEANPMAVLTAEQALEVRRLHASGLGYKCIGKLLGRPWGTIRNVVKRKTWRHV
jgi:hypothetical protein